MKAMLSILFATDFSPNSRVALRLLRLIKEKFETNIALVHVISSFWKNWFTSDLYLKEAMQRLESWQQELLGKSDPKKLFIELGHRADLILSKAMELNSDLIVLGSKNSQTKGRYKSGTTAESIVRHAKTSVLVCKKEKISKILCGIDGSDASGKALDWAIELAESLHAELMVLFVIPKVNVSALGMEEEEILQEEEKVEKENKIQIEAFLKNYDFSNLSVKKEFKWGIPSHVILDMAEDHEYDMIVMGAKGHSMIQHVLMGSTAEKVLHFAPCSLLIVR